MAVLQNMKTVYQTREDELDTKLLASNIEKMKNINYFSTMSKQSLKYSESLCEGIQMLLGE